MKTNALLFAALTPSLASAFSPAAKPRDPPTTLHMGKWFFEKSFHGGGSAQEDDLDEQWATQQAILQARRGHIDKEHLHKKYEGGGPKTFQLKGSKPMLHDNPALDGPGHHAVLDGVQGQQNKKKAKWFWEK